MNLTPTTELEAVNIMLGTIGQAPITSLERTGLLDAEIAQQVLAEVNRAVQMEGWHWNREENFPLPANTDGEVVVPSNVLEIEPVEQVSRLRKLTLRGNRIYDKETFSFNIGETLRYNMTVLLKFTELPEYARRYITLRSARVLQERMLMSDVVDAYAEKQERIARAMLERAEHRTANHNMVTGTYDAFDIAYRFYDT